MDTEWWYAIGDQKTGPLPLSDLLGRLSNNQITLETLVWQNGWEGWRKLADVKEVQPQIIEALREQKRGIPPPLPPMAGSSATSPNNSVLKSPAKTPPQALNVSTISRTENRVLMAQARAALKGKWGLAIGTFVVYLLVVGAGQAIPKVGGLISTLITGPMSIGLAMFALSLSRAQDAQLEQIFGGFKQFGVGLGAYLLTVLFVVLWSLLLIVPGIIAAFAYSQTFYIIAEDNSIGPLDAIAKSKAMMRGNKWKFFCLGCRFIGWIFLGVLSLGIGFLWLFPYFWISGAQFYDDLKTADR